MRLIGFLFLSTAIWGLPQGAEMQQGTSEIEITDHAMIISLSQNKTIVNWDSFSIGSAESVRINMPGKDSSMLNRVIGGNLSEIYGALSSNGQVWLLNPAGILIGQNAVIETAGFLASTFDVLNKDFLDGIVQFHGEGGRITHLGAIRAPYGTVHLVAKEVEVDGKIEADYFFAKGEALISYNPEVKADHPYAHAIRLSGDVRVGKEIVIEAIDSIEVSGTVAGDEIKCDLFADSIAITDDARMKTPRSHYRIGGSERGLDTSLSHASYAWIQKGATIDISGGAADAGSLILWGTKGVSFEGMVLGTSDQKGAFVEVSGQGGVLCKGVANLVGGKEYGTLLIDPVTLTISTSSTSGATIGDPTTFSADSVTINNTDLQNALGSGNVSIVATGGAQAGTGAVTWNSGAPITWSANTSFTLSGTTLTIDSSIQTTSTANTPITLTGTGAISLGATATTTISATGTSGQNAISISTTGSVAGNYTGISIGANASITSSAGNLLINGQGGTTGTIGTLLTGGSITVADGTTLQLTGVGGNAAGGSNYGIHLSTGTITVGSGGAGATAILTGRGGQGATGSNHGLYNQGATVTINGNSTLLFDTCRGGGLSGGNSGANNGILIANPITTTATGAKIQFKDISGGGNGTGANNWGLSINDAALSAPTIEMASGSNPISGGNPYSGTAPTGSLNRGIGIFGASSALGSTTSTTLINLVATGGLGTGSAGIEMGAGSLNIGDGGVLTLNGTGGGSSAAAVNSCRGITFSGGTWNIGNSTGASCTLTGQGGQGTTGAHDGVNISGAVTVNFVGGTLLFDTCIGGGATGGNSSSNFGVSIATTISTTASGSKIQFNNISGGGNGTGTNNYGLRLSNGVLSAPTIEMASGSNPITGGNPASGTAPTGTGNHGIFLTGASARIGSSSVANQISLVAQAGSSGTAGSGIAVTAAGKIQSAVGGSVTLTGTGGGGSSATNYGILVTGASSIISAVSGDVTLTGTPGAGATNGIQIETSGTLQRTNGGTLSLTASSGSIGIGAVTIDAGSGDLTFDSPVLLSATPTAITGSGTTTFLSTVNGTTANTENFSLGSTGSVVFSGAIGNTIALGAISIPSASSVTIGNTITASSLNITPAVTLSGSSTVTTTGNISLGAIDGTTASAQTLSLTPSGTAAIGSIGQSVPLNAFSITSGTGATLGGSITATSVQVTPAATISGNGTITTSGNISFSTIDGAMPSTQTLVLSPTGTAAVGIVGMTVPLASFTITNGDLPSSITADAISLLVQATLSGPLTLSNNGGSGTILIDAPIDGAYALIIQGGTGTTTFNEPVGETTPLASLDVTAGTIEQNTTVEAAGAISYTAPDITLGGDLITAGGTVDLDGAIVLAANLDINTTQTAPGGANIQTTSTIDGAFDLTVNAGTMGAATFDQPIGMNTRLSALHVTAANITVPSLIQTDSNTQTYVGPVTLIANTTFDDIGDNGISFSSTITGPYALTIAATGGPVTVEGAIDVSGVVDISSTTDGVTVDAITSGGNSISLQPGPGFTTVSGANIPNGILVLKGAIDAGAGAVTLSGTGRTELMSIATIAGDSIGSNLSITAGSLTLGDYETLTVFGDVDFTIGTTANFGDIVALGAISIISGVSNTIFSHQPGLIYDSSGALYQDLQTSILSATATPALTPTPSFTMSPGVIQQASFSSSTLLFGSYVLTLDVATLPPSLQSNRAEIIYNTLVAVSEMLYYRLPIWSEYERWKSASKLIINK